MIHSNQPTTTQKAKRSNSPHAIRDAVKVAKDKNPAFEGLKGLGIKNLDARFCFELQNQKDDKGHALKGVRVFWIRVKDGKGNAIEGKLFLPKRGKPNELVAYFPGFQGDGVVLFDDRHAPKIAKEGFAVFVTRHVTTIPNGARASSYVHCAERQDPEKLSQELSTPRALLSSTLGEHNREQFFEKWAREPRIVLEGLKDSFDKFHLIGHSWGGFNIAYSLMELQKEGSDAAKKVESFASLSGRIGSIRADGAWDDVKTLSTAIFERLVDVLKTAGIHKGIKEGMFKDFEKTDADLHKMLEEESFPKVRILLLTPGGDEYIHFSQAMDLLRSKAGRETDSVGLVYEPKGMKRPDGSPYEKHDFADMDTRELIGFIKGKSGHEQLREWFKKKE